MQSISTASLRIVLKLRPDCYERRPFLISFFLISSWLFSVIFSVSIFSFSKAKEGVLSHLFTEFLFNRGRSGELKVDKFRTNFE